MVSPKACSIWWKKMPTKPIKARAGQASLGGKGFSPFSARILKSSAVPKAKRVKIKVTGESSRSAAFVATNEQPHIRIVSDKAIGGGNVFRMPRQAKRLGYSAFGYDPRTFT